VLSGNLSSWKKMVDSPMPHAEALPEPWGQRLDSFQRLVLLRALRQDKLLPAVTDYVADTMGR
jgi:dynein heavy chain